MGRRQWQDGHHLDDVRHGATEPWSRGAERLYTHLEFVVITEGGIGAELQAIRDGETSHGLPSGAAHLHAAAPGPLKAETTSPEVLVTGRSEGADRWAPHGADVPAAALQCPVHHLRRKRHARARRDGRPQGPRPVRRERIRIPRGPAREGPRRPDSVRGPGRGRGCPDAATHACDGVDHPQMPVGAPLFWGSTIATGAS
jgi:hypothetical protein